MSSEIVVNGIQYVPSKEAAAKVGLVADYVSRMCRDRLVDGKLISDLWYVNETSLAKFLARQKQEEALRRASQAQLLKEERRRADRRARRTARMRHLPQTALLALTITLLLGTAAFSLSTPIANSSPALAVVASAVPVPIRASIDRVVTSVYNFVCPYFSHCNARSTLVHATPDTASLSLTQPPATTSATTRPALQHPAARIAAPIPQSPTIITQPVIERVRETVRTIVQGGIDEAFLDARLAALERDLSGRLNQVALAGAYQTNRTYDVLADALRIEELTDLILHNPVIDGATITGGSIAAASISGTLSNAISSALATILSLTATDLVATNATTTNATTTNLYVSGTATLGGGTGVLQSTSGVVSAITNGSAGQVLKIVAGVPVWSSDLTSSGGGSSTWATTTDDLALYPSDTADVILIGANATSTTGNIFEVNGSSLFRSSVVAYGLLTAPRFTATSSVASIFAYASTTAISATTASSTDLFISGVSSSLLKTTSSGQVAAAVAGTDYLNSTTGDWTGTFDGQEGSFYLASSFSTTSADAWKLNRNFFATTSADYWKTANNFFSTTSADFWETQQTSRTADDLTNNSIEDLSDVAAMTENSGDLFYWNGAAWTDLATSSLGIALSDTTGTLAISRGGTGASSFSYGLVLSPGGTGALTNIATSSLGLLTTNVAEGSNLYYTDGRVQTYLDTISKGFFFSTTSADAWKDQRNFFSTTSADYFLAQNQGAGFSTTSSQYFVHSSSTIPKTYTANAFTALQSFTNASTTNLSATYASSTQGFFGSLSVGSLTGLLKATAGAISTALVDLASDVTGILGVTRGGTGWASIASAAIPYGNGSSALATTTAGTPGQVLALLNGVPTWAATSTLSTISGTVSGTQLDGVFGSNGLLARTTTGTYASRTITGTANQIAVANGDGVSGNPTLSLPSLLFFTNASSSQQSIFSALYVGGTATTTIRGDGIASTIPFASSTMISATTASSTNLWISGIASGSLLKTTTGGQVTNAVAGTDYAAASSIFGKAWEVSGSFLAPTTTLYVTNIQQASSTLFSANRGYFGATATTTIDTAGNVAVAGTLDVTGKTTLGTASTTNLSATYASSTQGFFGSLSVGNLTGFLKATAGAIASAAIDLASDVTGILGVARGGTGWANIASAAIPYGNGAGSLATTTAGTPGQVLALLNGVPTWAATTTLSTITGTISGTQLDGVFSSNGLLARTTTGTYASRTLTGTANQIAVANGDGVSGNPTFSLPSLLFFTNASSTQQSIFDRLYVGGSATTTIRGDGIASTIPFASSTMISATTASSTNLWISSVASGSLLKTSTGGSVIAAVAGTDYAAASSIFGKSWEVSGNFLAPTTTNYVTNIQQASSTVFSALNASFGALTATSSLTVLGPSSFANSANFFGLTSFGATATTTISAAGTISTPSIIATNATSTSLFATNAAASTASFGATATSTFTSTGFLGIGTTTPGSALSIQGNIFLAGNLVSTSTVASVFPYASSTALTVSGTASTTILIVSSAGSSGTTCAQFSAAGLLSSTGSACGSGSGSAFPFTPTLNFGANTNATSTALSLFGGLNASSTVRFGNAGVSGFLFDTTTGNLGLGTTTPWAQLSVNPNGITGPAFVIGSSTATNFIVTNGGRVGIGTTSPGYTLDVNGDVNVATGKCFRVNGVCIGYTVKLAAIYATSTVGTTTVNFTGAQGAAPSFSAATLTLPSNTSHYVVEVWGGGGGGGAVATNNGAQGGTTCYSNNATACVSVLLSATGGGGGGFGANAGGAGGAGGSGSSGDVNITGGGGGGGANNFGSSGAGGAAAQGGGGGGGTDAAVNGAAGSAFGGGGAGGSSNAVATTGGGGGGGGYSRKLISNTTAATFTVGGGGAGGAAGTQAGGTGGTGGTVITVYATSSPNAAGNDYAEMFPVSNPSINAGDIVAVDAGVPVSMKLAQKGDTTLAGVISTNPGQVLGDQNATGQRPVALSGRVPVKVSLENGPIKIGHRIAPSSIPGVGKKAGPFDNSVGIVIDNVQPDGTVMIFLDLHQGIDINAIAFGLLGNDAFAVTSSSSPSTSSTTIATGPLDFVGGMMRAFASRLSLFTFVGSAASSTATTTDATSTPPAPPTDSYVVDLMHAIFSSITAWLADASNGITDFFAHRVYTQQLCVTDSANDNAPLCVTKPQLSALLSQTAAAATPTSVPTSPSEIREPDPPISVSSPATSTPPDLTNSESPPHESSTSTPDQSAPANDNTPPDTTGSPTDATVTEPEIAPQPPALDDAA